MNDKERDSLATLATDIIDHAGITFSYDNRASAYLTFLYNSIHEIIKGKEFKIVSTENGAEGMIINNESGYSEDTQND